MVSQYLNTYRTFTANTDWNMTHNLQSTLQKVGGGQHIRGFYENALYKFTFDIDI